MYFLINYVMVMKLMMKSTDSATVSDSAILNDLLMLGENEPA